MTEKILFEFHTSQRKSRYRYKIRCGKRTFIMREPKGVTIGKGRFEKTYPTTKRNIRQALQSLENLYDELYSPGYTHPDIS